MCSAKFEIFIGCSNHSRLTIFQFASIKKKQFSRLIFSRHKHSRYFKWLYFIGNRLSLINGMLIGIEYTVLTCLYGHFIYKIIINRFLWNDSYAQIGRIFILKVVQVEKNVLLQREQKRNVYNKWRNKHAYTRRKVRLWSQRQKKRNWCDICDWHRIKWSPPVRSVF